MRCERILAIVFRDGESTGSHFLPPCHARGYIRSGTKRVDVRDIAQAAAISLTEEGHAGKTFDLVSSEMLSGPGAATIWSRLLGKDVKYVGHRDFDAFEAQLRKTGNPSWLAYDLRVMYQGYVERGFSHTESQTARFAALLGREPRKYSSYAEELVKQWTS